MKNSTKGLTLVEIMVSLTIISVTFLGIMATFGAISAGIQSTKARTLATNIAQEKMQILKHISYNRLVTTVAPSYKTEFSPAIPYDNSQYAPDTVYEGGLSFERLTYVQMATEVGGNLIYLGATPDTGMKAITVTVLWRTGNEYKKIQIRSVTTNLNTISLNAVTTGTVTNSSNGMPINNASVVVAENIAWLDMTGADGAYSINLKKGDYNLLASARGFFSVSIPLTIASGQTIARNFSLTPMSSGTIRGTAWMNANPLISQVAASSVNASGFDQEYVELFNPTTYTWQMASDSATGIVGIKYKSTADPDWADPTVIDLNYITLSIPPYGYYLAANTNTITIAGVSRNADAIWHASTPGYPNIIKCKEDSGAAAAGGGVGIYYIPSGGWIDRVGWNRGTEGGSKDAPIREGVGIPQPAIGIERDEQFVRKTSTSGIVSGFANAYDSQNNEVDFSYSNSKPMIWPPRNTSSTATVVSGVPAVGAVVSCDDGLSLSETASAKGSPPCAEFTLTSVATGTWNVAITSDSYTMTVSQVPIAAHGQVVFISSAMTSPMWPAAGHNVVLLSNNVSGGFISGRVTNALGQSISPSIRVRAGASGADFLASASDGRYMISVSTGVYTVIANPNNINTQYVSQTRDAVVVNTGQITSGINFVLSQGGRIRGWVTMDRINPLPGVSMLALDSGGAVRAQDISGSDGHFSLVNLSTGVYTAMPELDSKETSVPSSSTATVTVGSNVFIGTFTITGAFGRISGRATVSGTPISTGVSIIGSTAPFSTANPPAISSQTSAGTPYYITNTNEDGTYTLEVRGSTTAFYSVIGFYPRMSGSSFWTSTATLLNIRALAGSTTANVNFSW